MTTNKTYHASRQLSRRQTLRRGALGAGGLILAGGLRANPVMAA